jgi:uncharacterized protein YukE
MALPADFPPHAATALRQIQDVFPEGYSILADMITSFWGDTGKIQQVIDEIWTTEVTGAGNNSNPGKIKDSANALSSNLNTLTQTAESHWEGPAAKAYIEWRNVFAAKTLEKFTTNTTEVVGLLEQAKTNVESTRVYIVIMVVETAAAVVGVAAGPAAPFVVSGALLALAATAGYAANDINNMWSATETAMRTLQQKRDVGPGGGYVSEPFKTDVAGDWWDWHNAPKGN